MTPKPNTPKKSICQSPLTQKLEIPSAPDLSTKNDCPPTYEKVTGTAKIDTTKSTVMHAQNQVIGTENVPNQPGFNSGNVMQQNTMMGQPMAGIPMQQMMVPNGYQMPMQMPMAQPIIMQQQPPIAQQPQTNQTINVNVGNTGGVQFPTSKNAKYGRKSKSLQCQHCNANMKTKVRYETSCGTLLVSLGLAVIQFWPCICIPCCVNDMKTARHSCPTCSRFLGKDDFIC